MHKTSNGPDYGQTEKVKTETNKIVLSNTKPKGVERY
jgi:hypothetical protein